MCHPNEMDGGTGEGIPFPTNLTLFSILTAAPHMDLVRKKPAAPCKCEASILLNPMEGSNKKMLMLLHDSGIYWLYLKHLQSDLIWTFILWLEELLHQNDPKTPKKAHEPWKDINLFYWCVDT